jgi:hypothetical protein
MTVGRREEGKPRGVSFAVVLGVLEESLDEERRLRLMDAEGEEFASLTGRFAGPAWVAAKGEQVAELAVSSGGLTAKVRIPLDVEARCTISPDGTMTGSLPSGAQWNVTPLGIEEEEA